jgi:hypothetical protein
MSWKLELRRRAARWDAIKRLLPGRRGRWEVWTEGPLEECMLGLIQWRAGDHVAYDAARIVAGDKP